MSRILVLSRREFIMLLIADVVGGLHRQGDWNDDRQTRGCVAGP